MQVSTRSLFFTAWTAAALFGRGLHSWVSEDDDDKNSASSLFDAPAARTVDSAASLDRFKRVSKQFALTDSQRLAVDQAVSRLQPLIVQLRKEVVEKQQSLVALHPGSERFHYDTRRLSKDVGTLATRLVLASCMLKSEIHAILTAEQQSMLGELHAAFESYK